MLSTPNPLLSVPPLENGDRLTRAEFERRYAAMPHLRKAELVEGVVYMASPLRFRSHGEPHGDLIGWLWNYKVATPGVALGIEPTVRLDSDNEPQPDAVLFVPGRQAWITSEDYIEGAPELVVEVAASSAALDLYDKKQAYHRNGVQEYLVWRTLEGQLDWFLREPQGYVAQVPDEQGMLQSRIFPGLGLALPALLSGEMGMVLSALQASLHTPIHQAFAATLRDPQQE
ncbi:MAG: Uma2 family endonuclease [Thermostichus sp. BF3_bins_97]